LINKEVNQDRCRAFLLSYAETRSEVTSAHKLPTEGELVDIAAKYFGHAIAKRTFNTMVTDGTLKKQGPYYGTEIKDVL